MKKNLIWMLASLVSFLSISHVDAMLIRMTPPASLINNPQSLEVIVVNNSGNVTKQNAYYDPIKGGIELNIGQGGPNTSLYIPAWQTGYLWMNGHWVDETGSYWTEKGQMSLGISDWKHHWVNYWGKYWHDKRGYWPRSPAYSEYDRKLYLHRDREAEMRQRMEESRIKGFGESNQLHTENKEDKRQKT